MCWWGCVCPYECILKIPHEEGRLIWRHVWAPCGPLSLEATNVVKSKILGFRLRCSRCTIVLVSTTGDGCCKKKLSKVNRLSTSGTFVYKKFRFSVVRMKVPETMPVQFKLSIMLRKFVVCFPNCGNVGETCWSRYLGIKIYVLKDCLFLKLWASRIVKFMDVHDEIECARKVVFA